MYDLCSICRQPILLFSAPSCLSLVSANTICTVRLHLFLIKKEKKDGGDVESVPFQCREIGQKGRETSAAQMTFARPLVSCNLLRNRLCFKIIIIIYIYQLKAMEIILRKNSYRCKMSEREVFLVVYKSMAKAFFSLRSNELLVEKGHCSNRWIFLWGFGACRGIM